MVLPARPNRAEMKANRTRNGRRRSVMIVDPELLAMAGPPFALVDQMIAGREGGR